MYVCLCHGFTDRDVHRCLAGDAVTVGDVYRTLGHQPRCAKCVPTVRQLVKGEGSGLVPTRPR